MAEFNKLTKAMCSIDLAESQWTQELPRLPVPDLWLTVSRYLASLKAVLAPTKDLDDLLSNKPEACELSNEQLRANWKQYERTEQLVKKFMLNEAPELQRDLREYANKCQNWATEYWLQDMYLSNSIPLPINSNPYFLFPRQTFAHSNEMLMFATRIIQFSVDFKYRIDQQSLKQDYGSGHGKGKAMCMETYKNFFHSYRMPHEDMDRLLPQSRRSNHIVVASCNQFYILRLGQDPLDDPYRREPQTQLNEASIFEQLLRIYRVSREHAKRNQSQSQNQNQHQRQEGTKTGGRATKCAAKIGLLTTENRKTWAKLHKKLSHCSHGPQATSQLGQPLGPIGAKTTSTSTPNVNTESLRQIEDCLFVMCLDSLVNNTQNSQQVDEVQAAKLILTGGGTNLFTANRWFDKFLQIIVGRNGVCGINIEHSASEGITVLRFLEEFLHFIRTNPIGDAQTIEQLVQSTVGSAAADRSAKKTLQFDYEENNKDETGPQVGAGSISSPSYVEPKSPSELLEESDKITTLSWQLNDELELAIEEAEAKINKSIENFSHHILNFDQFGRGFIKRQNLSPDAFVQLALQYTFFKLHGHLVSTYESASLRQFRLGRVDNIRANTCEAYDWIQHMLSYQTELKKISDDSNTTTTTASGNGLDILYDRAESSFIKAVTKQVEILRYTIVGGAPDNHLLALKEMAKIRYGPDELPDVFTDQSYNEFLNFRLSTSQLPNESGITVGYGAVVPDGYGCSYNPREEKIVFCISSWNDCPLTNSALFASRLAESMEEMRQLCLKRNDQRNF